MLKHQGRHLNFFLGAKNFIFQCHTGLLKNWKNTTLYVVIWRYLQSRIKVFWGPRLDTTVGPHTHPIFLSSSDPINLTGVWGITTEKVWNCKCHSGVSEA